MPIEENLDLESVRARLRSVNGKEYWRSLEELADDESFQELLRKKFPRQARWLDSTIDAMSRRHFLKLMGASLALAGLSGCTTRRPSEEIVPYVEAPEEIVPGKPLFFATATTLDGYATGVLVENHMGRPTKIEGNPDHPASLGATNTFMQAEVLSLYDPDRSQAVLKDGQISTWGTFLEALSVALDSEDVGLRLLTGTVTSPTLADQIQKLLQKYPSAQWHQYEPVTRDNLRAGAQLAFGEYVDTRYRFDQADVILTLDADFLFGGPGSVRYARDFGQRCRVRADAPEMNRLYAVESTSTITGSVADHRLPLQASRIQDLARAVARQLGMDVPAGNALPASVPDNWIGALARDLQDHRGRSLVVAGVGQPPVVHALAHAMNQFLDNVGNSVVYSEPVAANPVDQTDSLRQLVQDMEAGSVELLVVVGGNPVYSAPADLRFAEQMMQVPTRIHLGLYEDETAALCNWHIPAAHTLEMWGDARAYDGTTTLIQPLIEPLYGGKSAYELLAALLEKIDRRGYDIVRAYWQGQDVLADFETDWQVALHDGVIEGTQQPPKKVSLQTDFLGQAGQSSPDLAAGESSLEVIFAPDPSIWDGRFANNGWLQELPKPLTKLTWDNAALISPATAQRLGLDNQDWVELRYRDRQIQAPVWIVPGHAPDSVTLHLGYGRSRTGHVGRGAGFNAYALRPSDAPWFGTGLVLSQSDGEYDLVTTQHHHSMEGRHIVRATTLQGYAANSGFPPGAEVDSPEISLYPERTYEGYAWGMSIDLTACIGCSACVVACQAENNIPVVGKTEVDRGHEMHWLRVDRYYQGDLDNPETYHQPVPCMHCENAPCEVVCPVGATVHSDEGLNDMIYNRCVGTRYCSNNCPYKVRRFNFLQYSEWETESLKLGRNPDVTVRSRGVMEKCTYCVQRINAARIEAEKADRPIRDGEIRTACQQACPTQAIVFGDINDLESAVSQRKAHPLDYTLLAELNTRPRTTYLAQVQNPNPELVSG